MAYYPGYYYRTAPQHIGDYYSQSLFGAPRTWPHDFDPYADSYYGYDHDHVNERSQPLSPTHYRSHPTRNAYNNNPPSSSPPRSSPPPETQPPAASPSPSPSYLRFSSTPSKTLTEPTRKLLILDLNGTLLLRSPRAPKSYHGRRHQHPAPLTRAWLDVMVWSSAQPHSVEDMKFLAI